MAADGARWPIPQRVHMIITMGSAKIHFLIPKCKIGVYIVMSWQNTNYSLTYGIWVKTVGDA